MILCKCQKTENVGKQSIAKLWSCRNIESQTVVREPGSIPFAITRKVIQPGETVVIMNLYSLRKGHRVRRDCGDHESLQSWERS